MPVAFSCEGRRSQSSVARTPSLALPPRWARKEFCVVVCAALLTFVCMLRYSKWNVVPIWFLYSSIFIVIRYADLVPIFFDIYGGMLCWPASWDSSGLMMERCADLLPEFFIAYSETTRRHSFTSTTSGQDAKSASIPRMFFSYRLEASARGRWHRAGLLRRRGDYYLGCGRRRYCGRACCLSRRRVLALPQCF